MNWNALFWISYLGLYAWALWGIVDTLGLFTQ
jgi:hypothetical protein